MNPNASKISQLLVVSALKTLLILMVLKSGVVDSVESCRDAKLVKPAFFYNICSNKFLGVRDKQVVADYRTYHTLYMITSASSHGFLLYDLEAKMFLCWKHNRKRSSSRLVPKESPKNISLCIFEDLPFDSAHTKYVSEKNKHLVMSFKRNGAQRLIKRNGLHAGSGGGRAGKRRKGGGGSCPEEGFMQSYQHLNETECSAVQDKFCNNLRKVRHHNRVVHHEVRHVCDIAKQNHHHRGGGFPM